MRLMLVSLFVLLTFFSGAAFADSPLIPADGAPSRGPANAPVTIVVFSEFQCPYCAKVVPTLNALERQYGTDLRIVFRHNPLAFHKNARLAAQASMAAHAQGKFWLMHDQLFNEQGLWGSLPKAQFEKELDVAAKQASLNVRRFGQALRSTNVAKIIDRDMALAAKLGVRGTPHFFINGIRLTGAQPLAKFKAIIDGELASGRTSTYKKRVASNYKPVAPPQARDPKKNNDIKVAYVPIEKDDAITGGKNALVTGVGFSDFVCLYCVLAEKTMAKLRKKYGSKLQYVAKHNPLSFHKNAKLAAQAALAAKSFGKYWQMHEYLFRDRKALKAGKPFLITAAKKVGLKEGKFLKKLDSPAIVAQVERDMALAQELGARGTPTFYINGIKVAGARSQADFEEIIDEQLKVAKKIKTSQKLKGVRLYKAIVKANESTLPTIPSNAVAKKPGFKTQFAKVGRSTIIGKKSAPVTVFFYGDLQCPFTKRHFVNMQKLLVDYPKDVRLVFKAYPLPFHREAEQAHRATFAAGLQGKSWEMAALIFENQNKLKGNPLVFERLAEELGLKMSKFKKDLKSKKVQKQLDRDMAQVKKVGVRGTPNTIVGSEALVGAVPYAKIKKMVDAELNKKSKKK